MEWKGRRGSRNVEDRRGMGGKTLVGGGIGGIVILLFVMFLGGDPGDLLNNLSTSPATTEYVETEQDKELAEFVSVVLADTEDVWTEVFEQEGMDYREPILVLFSGSVQSACGMAGSAVGPFYCPADEKLYIDLSFYNDLQTQFKAPGDFAMAYVIAHEVGHHVQKLLGITDEMARIRSQVSGEEYNKYLGPSRIASRLSRRRMGTPCTRHGCLGGRRFGRSTDCSERCRGRHNPEKSSWLCSTGKLSHMELPNKGKIGFIEVLKLAIWMRAIHLVFRNFD